ncbi:hypothetical protein ACFYOT_11270 [Saccharothrix saharensis]|uniref:hypothetical protein n=1 Tax=Saccharothrix saharensis TaxID=571190 RepID=UPI0036AFD1CF
MLVQVEGVTRSASGAALVEVRTSVGTVTVRWCGDLEATPGAHHVEWELDEEFRWGPDCHPVDAGTPRLGQDERGAFFRGRLGLTSSTPAFAHLELADAVVDLGRVDALPDDAAGSWVEVHLEPGKVAAHPYSTERYRPEGGGDGGGSGGGAEEGRSACAPEATDPREPRTRAWTNRVLRPPLEPELSRSARSGIFASHHAARNCRTPVAG